MELVVAVLRGPLCAERRLSSRYFEYPQLPPRPLYFNDIHLPHNNANAVGPRYALASAADAGRYDFL